MRCPVCKGSSVFSQGEQFFDDRYGEPNIYLLARCNNCNHVSTAPRLKETDLSSLYGTYYPRKNIAVDDVINQATKVKGAFAKVVRWWDGTNNQGQYSVHNGETVLDVGCGNGVSLLEAKALGATAFGIEADPNIRFVAKSLNLTIYIGSLYDNPFPQQSFNLIILNQVIEHMPDPDFVLEELYKRLAPMGRIILALPNRNSLWRHIVGNRWINWHIPYHQHHFDHKSFVKMAKNCGLEVKFSRTITPNIWTFLQLRSIFYKPERGQPNPIWATSEIRQIKASVNRKSNLLKGIFRIGIMSIIAMTNRIIDVLGLGESLVFELHKSKY